MEVRTEHSVAALTFDDGPDEHNTEAILDVLARHSATATFFVLAQRAAQLPEILDAIRAGGHEIALHGDDHSILASCSARAKIRKIQKGKRRLEELLDEPIRFYRPPYGWQDVRGFLAARMVARLDVVGWSASGSDWVDITPAEVADRVSADLVPGAIILLHERYEPLPWRSDDVPPTALDRAQVVEEVIARASAQGINLVSVGALLERGFPVGRPWFSPPLSTNMK
ncbi:MAG: polysaccharide deacetylase family protein [Actinomycetota bacterium]